MLIAKKPYFMKNKEWYYHDIEESRYKLTEKATKKAIRSYIDYYKLLNSDVEYDDFDEKKLSKEEKILRDLLEEYHILFPKDGLFPEWNDIPYKDKIEMLKESVENNRDISRTELFEKYVEKIIDTN